jgi:hypothetical protein
MESARAFGSPAATASVRSLSSDACVMLTPSRPAQRLVSTSSKDAMRFSRCGSFGEMFAMNSSRFGSGRVNGRRTLPSVTVAHRRSIS